MLLHVTGRSHSPKLLSLCRQCAREPFSVVLALPSAVIMFLLSVSPAHGDPALTGQFSPVMTWSRKAVHAQLLPTGKVLWWPSFDNGDNPTVWNPATNVNSSAPRAGANIFCSGHAFLPNGQLLVAGGHVSSFTGLPNAYIFNGSEHNWTPAPSINI